MGKTKTPTLTKKINDSKTSMRCEIELETTFVLTYDPESKEFKDSFESYTDSIDSDATIDDMLRQVAFHVNRFGAENMVEGVGYVSVKGELAKEKKDYYSGIDLADDEPDPLTEIYSHKKINP